MLTTDEENMLALAMPWSKYTLAVDGEKKKMKPQEKNIKPRIVQKILSKSMSNSLGRCTLPKHYNDEPRRGETPIFCPSH